MAAHRPLSPWFARIRPGTETLGAINDGDERADARQLSFFAHGWQRRALPWHGSTVLGLDRDTDGVSVVELDDYGAPITAGPAAIAVVAHAEETWPLVGTELLALAQEELPLRYWLLERLDAEGEPPDDVFAILPWDLLDLAAASVVAAFEPGSTLGELVELGHWLTPAVRGVTGPLEQLDHGLRTSRPELVRRGATALLTNLRDLPLTRVPTSTRYRLGVLVARLGEELAEHRQLAVVVHRRLIEGTNAVPDDLSAVWFATVAPTSYLGPGDAAPPADWATLDFDAAAHAVLGPDVRGRVARDGAELTVTLTRVSADAPPIAVAVEPDAVAVPLVHQGRGLRARITWDRADLPRRLAFRAVTG